MSTAADCLSDEKAREILKKHCAVYGDKQYEPALWVIAALKDAVAQEREACAKWYAEHGWKLDEDDVADAMRKRPT